MLYGGKGAIFLLSILNLEIHSIGKVQCFLMLRRLEIKVLNTARAIFCIPGQKFQIHSLATCNNFGPAHFALIVTTFCHLLQVQFFKNIIIQNSVSINILNEIIQFNGTVHEDRTN